MNPKSKAACILSKAVVVLAALIGPAQAGLITPTAATASSALAAYGRQAIHTIDGSGMTGDGSAGTTCSTGENGLVWTSNGNLAAPNDLDPYIVYDLGAVHDVTVIREWGYNDGFVNGKGTASFQLGAKDVDVYTSTDNVTYSFAGTIQFAKAPGTSGYLGVDHAVNFPRVRYIKLDIMSNWDGAVFDGTGANPGPDGNGLAGLSEIRFESVAGLSAPTLVSDFTNGYPIAIPIPVANSTGTPYNVTGISYSGSNAADFNDSTSLPLTIPAGDSADIFIDFTPSTGGLSLVTVTLATDDPIYPSIDVLLYVEVRDPEIEIDTNHDFGVTATPGAIQGNIAVDNYGETAPLILSNPQITGSGAAAFSVTTLPAPIAPYGFDDVVVSFNPASGGYFTAQLTLDTNDPFTPGVTVDLTGELTSDLIVPMAATASSALAAYGRQAIHSIDGSGMTGDGSAGTTCSTGENGVVWTTNGNIVAPNDLDPEITYDLGAISDVTKIREWGYNDSTVNSVSGRPATGFSPNEVDIYTSVDGIAFSFAGTVNFAQAPGINGYAGHEIAVNYPSIRYIKLDIKSNWDGAVFNGTGSTPGPDGRGLTGLSEIRFETGLITAEVKITAVRYDGGSFEADATGLDPAKQYQLTRSANLQDGFPDVVDGPRLSAGATDTFIDSSPPAGHAFYRVEEAP